jgi:hypothetical protein
MIPFERMLIPFAPLSAQADRQFDYGRGADEEQAAG